MRRTFGTSLVIRTSSLIFLALAVFALGSYRLIVLPAVHGLAEAQMSMVSQQTDARIHHLLNTVETTLRSSRGWGMNGDLDHDQLQRFNEFFFPIIANHGEISSVNFAHESGREILLLQTPDGKWVNRISDPAHWGRKAQWLTYGANRVLEKTETRELDYDTRQRPWFKGAMALADDNKVHWTEPYIFFTTREPGITAAMRWTGKDGSRFVIGHDVKLLDLSRFTTTLRLGKRGTAALLKDDGALLALPYSPQIATDEQLKAAVLKPAAEIGLGNIATAYADWNKHGRPAGVHAFDLDGERWLTLFRPTTVGENRFWLAAFAPEREFVPGQAGDLVLLLVISLAALALGSLVALRVARRFAAPLEVLAAESARIGRMDLAAPVAAGPLEAPWREVRQLARAQEKMRQRLLEGKTALEDANTQLEGKVAERTKALAHQVALVEALLDIIPNPIFYKGADTRFIGCNQAYEAAFGVGRASFIGKRVLDLDYLPEDVRQAFQAEDERVIGEGGRLSRAEQLTFADGAVHDVLYSVTGFRSADGSPGGLIGVIVDISVLKAAEREACEARALAEAAAATKAEFIANMSHEIRTPMNTVIGMTQLALQTELDARQRNYLEKVNAAANGLLALINDILDFSKIEAGKLSCERTDFSLESVISHVADLAAIRIRNKGLELLFDIPADVPPQLAGDPLRLGQVLTNLVGNAVKFTEKGEITLAVSRLADDGSDIVLRFEVRDTGIGMREDEVGRIFDAFSQADGSTTRRYGGTGLGLSISKHIVELMGGEIGVTSAPGVGSRFFFTARFGHPAASGKGAAPTLSPEDICGLPVLVVDDNAAAREVFQHMLLSLRFAVHAVAGGAEALAELERAANAGEPYRLVLIDWKMPGMDGVETLRRIHASFSEHRPLCLLVTAYDRDSLADVLGTTPVDGIVDKPATASTLLDAIMTASSRRPAPVVAGKKPAANDRLQLPALRQALAGKRVLLVEDNVTNQELALELLANVGIAADVASDGEEALARIAAGDYALVLMDCQMPVLDGLAATRRLREDRRFKELPVVAMTANAMSGEREKCLAAGMNDYLAKPIDIAGFYALLCRWLAPDFRLPPA
ncbi:MAG: response regulator, partial [Betaproteobacteria bacterium]